MTDGRADEARSASDAARLRRWARLVLVPVAGIGAALSFAGLYEAARPTYGPVLAAGFPFLVDFLVLGASLQYLAGAMAGRPRAGWRLTAHAGVAGTLVLNALASPDLAHLPWHVVAPAVWSVLVEMSAREVVGQWRATHRPPVDRIPGRLWLTAPVESVRTWLLMARVGSESHRGARLDVGVQAAATEALRLALPGRVPRRVRRIIRRQLRAGSLPPADVLASLGWTAGSSTLERDPATVLRATLQGVLTPAPTSDAAPVPAAERPPASEVAPDVAAPPAPAAQAPASTAPGAPAAPTAPAAEVAAVPALGDDLFAGLLDAPRRPVNDPIFSAVAAVAAVAPMAADDGSRSPAAAAGSTGDRPSDAVALLQVDPTLDAARLAEQLRALGWVLSDRTAVRVLGEARHYLRAGRLTAVR